MNAPSKLLLGLALAGGFPLAAQCGPGGSHGSHGGYATPEPPPRAKARATNTRCPVMNVPVAPGKHPETQVEGRFYLLCCEACAPELADHPEKYLDAEGRPLNERGGARRERPADPPPSSEHRH